jgi:hypothetical protein
MKTVYCIFLKKKLRREKTKIYSYTIYSPKMHAPYGRPTRVCMYIYIYIYRYEYLLYICICVYFCVFIDVSKDIKNYTPNIQYTVLLLVEETTTTTN